jgi:hypothetical protein
MKHSRGSAPKGVTGRAIMVRGRLFLRSDARLLAGSASWQSMIESDKKAVARDSWSE